MHYQKLTGQYRDGIVSWLSVSGGIGLLKSLLNPLFSDYSFRRHNCLMLGSQQMKITKEKDGHIHIKNERTEEFPLWLSRNDPN